MRNKYPPLILAGGIFLLSLWAVPAVSDAGTLNQIQLSDGSRVHAEIVSYANGIYRLRSKALGTFSIAEEQIQSIQPLDSSGAGATQAPAVKQIQQLQQEVMANPKTMKMILDLQNDPSIKSILQDKELMQAIEKGNMNRVGQDPKIKSLMKNGAIADILKRHQPK